MANVMFRKGLRANLPATYNEGTFYVTTDERAIYLDVSNEARIRLGDFQEFATVTALEANPNPSTTALYYVNDINCLAKWNGSSYVQINRDTGMTSVEVVGEGNAVTAAVYSADGRKLTLTKGASYVAISDFNDLKEKVEALEVVGGQANVIEKVKVNGDDLAITGKAVDVLVATGSANGTIAVNNKDVAVKGLGSAAFTDATAYDAAGAAATAAGAVQSDLDTYKASNNAAVEAAAAKGQQGITDAAAALKAAQDAQSTADSKATKAEVLADVAKDYVNNTTLASTKTTIEQGYAAADTALKNELTPLINAKVAQDAYNTKMGELDKSIEDLGKEDERLAGLIGDNTDAIGVERGRIDDHNDRLVAIEAFFEGAASDEGEGENLKNALDTLVEIQNYITGDGEAAQDMLDAIDANDKAIKAEAKAREEADGTLQGNINAVSAEVAKKAAQSDFDTLKGRVDTAEGEIDTLQSDLDKAEEDIAGLKTSKADASVVTNLSKDFTDYQTAHKGDYTNAQIDAAIDADVKVVSDALSAYETAHASDYTNKQIDDAISGAASTAQNKLDTAIAGVEGKITKEAQDRAAAITSAIEALDSSVAAQDDYALTGITIVDGKITTKTEAKFATEGYVNNQIAAAALSWGTF